MSILFSILGFFVTLLLGPKQQIDRYWQGVSTGGGVVGAAWLGVHLIEKLKVQFIDLVALGLATGFFYFQYHAKTITPPAPEPPVAKQPRKPILPWRRTTDNTTTFVEGDTGPGGLEVTTDLPREYRKANIESKGLGCCVFRSADHALHWANLCKLYGMPEWMKAKGIEGGGYPQKVDDLLKKFCEDRKVPLVDYVQYEGNDPKFLELALKTGRMVCVTYNGHDPRYGMNKSIAHMVNLIYLDSTSACILDNNFIDKPLWMSRTEFLTRWKGGEQGWAFVFLASPPPPVPFN